MFKYFFLKKKQAWEAISSGIVHTCVKNVWVKLGLKGANNY